MGSRNKGERHRIKMLKYKKRLRIYGLKECHSLRTSGKPCSCFMCSPEKYSKKERNIGRKEIQNQLAA